MESSEEIEDGGVPDDLVEVRVVRDGPLPRFSADIAIPADLGRDLEIAFLIYTTKLEAEVSRRGSTGSESRGMRMSGELLELVRVRMPRASARDLAMGLLQQLIGEGLVDASQVKTEIDRMIPQLSPSIEAVPE